MSHQGEPDAFFDWCERIQISPNALSYYFERGKREWKISIKAFKVMKQVEQLKACCKLCCALIGIDLVSRILND